VNRRSFYLVLAMVLASLLAASCAQSSPAPAPTQSPAAKAAGQPTTGAAVAQPTTSAPAKKVDYPVKGRSISLIVPFAAGGGTDLTGRILAASLEQQLGIPVQVVNKAGAGSQVGITDLAQSKPDGYTLGIMTLPNVPLIYMDPDRKAAFGRKDLQPVAAHVADVGAIAVKADSPYKTVADLVAAAKAKPNQINLTTTGILGPHHLAILMLQKAAGVQFGIVHFDSSQPGVVALMGGHVDAVVGFGADLLPQVKSGELRLLGVMDSQQNKFMPGVKTFQEQGYDVQMTAVRLMAAPAGTPQEIVNIVTDAVKKGIDTPDHQTKLDTLGVTSRYMDPTQLSDYWTKVETQMKPLLDEAKASQPKP
jgi:tripartite-type tricarboxylate transporter receptor subunit TctC